MEMDPATWKDPLLILDRTRTPTESLRDLLAGGGAFLLGGGPSVNDLPLELLRRRGVFTLAINNAAGHPRIRPQAFICSDPPKKFSHSIWLDPAVMKFVPTPKMSGGRARLRAKRDGQFYDLARPVTQCPNVWGFNRLSWLTPDDSFFTEPGALWGNHNAGVQRTGQPKSVCTMLLGLRVLYYLGARRVYLLGVDFRMSPDYGYSFNHARDEGASAGNNNIYAVVNRWLCEMQEKGVFDRFGLTVLNCYQNSGLRAFPHCPFEDAVKDAVGIIEEIPDLSHWYDGEEKKK